MDDLHNSWVLLLERDVIPMLLLLRRVVVVIVVAILLLVEEATATSVRGVKLVAPSFVVVEFIERLFIGEFVVIVVVVVVVVVTFVVDDVAGGFLEGI